jgi:hypothetical protein
MYALEIIRALHLPLAFGKLWINPFQAYIT